MGKKLDKEEIRSLGFIGVSMWAIFLVAILCIWVAPKHFGDGSMGGIDGTENGFLKEEVSSSSSEVPSSEVEQSTDIEGNENYLTELPEKWEQATARNYLRQMFFTDAASWGYKDGEEPMEVITEDIYNNKWGLPCGIWRLGGEDFTTDEINIIEADCKDSIVSGLYITEIYETDLETLAQELANTGVHVNIIPASVDLTTLGVEGVREFVTTMHKYGVSAGIYYGDIMNLGTYIQEGIALDCIVVSSQENAVGLRPCITEVPTIRELYAGAIFMEACTQRGWSSQQSKDLITEAIDAGCDAVSVRYIEGDSSSRAMYAFGYLVEQEAERYEGEIHRLKESVLRLLNLDRTSRE